MNRPVILASASSRRRELLSLVLKKFTVKASSVDETEFLTDATPSSVEQAALAKARDIAEKVEEGSVIVAADTVISFLGNLLGKPEDDEHAASMLKQLRGRKHSVITGGVVMDIAGSKQYIFHESTKVRMRDVSDREILDYIASGEPLDKAGAYAIQGLGRELVQSFQGCYPNVVGFPLCAIVSRLNLIGIETRPVMDICPGIVAGAASSRINQTGDMNLDLA